MKTIMALSTSLGLVLLLIGSTQSVEMMKKLFKGCDPQLVETTVGTVMQCLKSELSQLQKMAESAGAPDVPTIVKLQDETFQDVVIPSIGKTICKKRVKLLECVQPIMELTCMEDIIQIGLQVGMKYFIRPIFYYTCDEIILVENAVGDLIRCGLAIHADVMGKCIPKVNVKEIKPEAICSLIGGPYKCLINEMDNSCSELAINKTSGLFQLISKNLGCKTPSAINSSTAPIKVGYSNTELLNSVSDDQHVNINRLRKKNSAATNMFTSAFALTVPFLLTLKSFFH